MAVWYDVIISLREHIRAAAGMESVKVEAGALDPQSHLKDAGAGLVLVYRDREPDEKLFKGGEGIIEIKIECWTRSNDKDPAVGYGLLSALEDKLTAALASWATTAGPATTGADIIHVEVDETIGDGDVKRPLIGSRKAVRVEWSKRTL